MGAYWRDRDCSACDEMRIIYDYIGPYAERKMINTVHFFKKTMGDFGMSSVGEC